jgi:hypothetical protein
MPRGRPSKWAMLKVNQPIWLTKTGVEIVIWDKWGRRRKGTLALSVGGIRWYPYKGKKPRHIIRWDRLARF